MDRQTYVRHSTTVTFDPLCWTILLMVPNTIVKVLVAWYCCMFRDKIIFEAVALITACLINGYYSYALGILYGYKLFMTILLWLETSALVWYTCQPISDRPNYSSDSLFEIKKKDMDWNHWIVPMQWWLLLWRGVCVCSLEYIELWHWWLQTRYGGIGSYMSKIPV